jgi:hypothetical protein
MALLSSVPLAAAASQNDIDMMLAATEESVSNLDEVSGCSACLKIVERLENELDTKELRTSAAEVVAYLSEVCDDMDYYYDTYVVDYCRRQMTTTNVRTIGGLLQIAQNIKEATCKLTLKVRPRGPLPATRACHQEQCIKNSVPLC